MKSDIDYSLYLVTDRQLLSTRTLEEAVEQAVLGGCTVIQLREKTASSLAFYNTALSIRKITRRYNVPLIINDRLDIMLASDADGIHVGQNDMPASAVKKLIGKDKLLGVSVSTVLEAKKAFEDGADYIGVGAMFPTGTKNDANIVPFDTLLEIRKAVTIPIVVIGGINKNTIHNFSGTGINGAAVVSAILAQKNICMAAGELLAAYNATKNTNTR